MKILFLLALISFSWANKIQDDPIAYLERFGYMSTEAYGSQDVETALRDLQRAGGIQETGKLDDATRALMVKPRCGVPDVGRNAFDGMHVAFSGGVGGKWRNLELTYAIESYTPDLSRSMTKAIIARALRYWSEVSRLNFREISGRGADIRVNFGAKDHGYHAGGYKCPYPFDGPGGTLAHAYFPENGRIHFDEDEYFTFRDSRGIDLLWVAAHEFGHTLGLHHSDSQSDLMYPWYQFSTTFNKLPNGDKYRIQNLYGARITPLATQVPVTSVITEVTDVMTSEVTGPPTEPPPCPTGWKQYRRSCYVSKLLRASFWQAKIYCERVPHGKNAALVSVLDQGENEFVRRMVAELRKGYVWLGITDYRKEGDWVWTDGSKSTYRRFGRHEARRNRAENCAIIDYNGIWQDWPCSSRHIIICKQKAL